MLVTSTFDHTCRSSPVRAGSIPRPSAPDLRLWAPGPGACSHTQAAACASPSASCRLSVSVRGPPGCTRCCLWCCPANRAVSPETARHERSPLITTQGLSGLALRLSSLRSRCLLDLTRQAMWINSNLTFKEGGDKLTKLHLDSSFCTIADDSKSRWSHGRNV